MTIDPRTPAPHARAFDLPGWPCPPRVRDIAGTKNSWGGVPIGSINENGGGSGVVQDDLGRLWANGDLAPQFDTPGEFNSPLVGGVLFWSEVGLGVYVHPSRYRYLPSLSTFGMTPDKWVPIATVAEKLPDFVQLHNDDE